MINKTLRIIWIGGLLNCQRPNIAGVIMINEIIMIESASSVWVKLIRV